LSSQMVRALQLNPKAAGSIIARGPMVSQLHLVRSKMYSIM
jgi:hypothetical protein